VLQIGREILFAFAQVKKKNLKILPFQEQHWHDVSEIYRQGIFSRDATFETILPDYDTWIKKFHRHLLWVMLDETRVVGWAGLLPMSNRKVYEGVAEVSIYIHQDMKGKGIGTSLMTHLIAESEKSGIWTLHAAIFPENKTSIALHLKMGFREIGYREKIARLDGQWRNSVLFERRSTLTGI
jgi:L-amino acid N-acyltransferase YncA